MKRMVLAILAMALCLNFVPAAQASGDLKPEIKEKGYKNTFDLDTETNVTRMVIVKSPSGIAELAIKVKSFPTKMVSPALRSSGAGDEQQKTYMKHPLVKKVLDDNFCGFVRQIEYHLPSNLALPVVIKEEIATEAVSHEGYLQPYNQPPDLNLNEKVFTDTIGTFRLGCSKELPRDFKATFIQVILLNGHIITINRVWVDAGRSSIRVENLPLNPKNREVAQSALQLAYDSMSANLTN